MPVSCSSAAAAMTTSASFGVKPCSARRPARRRGGSGAAAAAARCSSPSGRGSTSGRTSGAAPRSPAARTTTPSAADRRSRLRGMRRAGGLRSAGALICICAMASSYIARNFPRLAGATLVTALVLGISACGDDSVEVGDYANDLCTALKGWTQDIRDSQAELQESPIRAHRSRATGTRCSSSWTTRSTATDELGQEVEDAGEPDIDGGGEVRDALQEAVEDTRSRLEEARDAVGEIPADSPEDYRAAVDEFVDEPAVNARGHRRALRGRRHARARQGDRRRERLPGLARRRVGRRLDDALVAARSKPRPYCSPAARRSAGQHHQALVCRRSR